MSKSIVSIFALGLLVTLAACSSGTQEEIVFVEPEVVVAEPVYAGKYK
ncbi:MAG: hypothetical protein P8Q99_06215 [Paracoccaceae bacterium]|nr:hypothetical protein RB2150_16217 [Rhodobacterales bacterium HTCC2150] [Rhodobacteraceae bacterium HTCC2150]MDG1530932.1 hypothetical protein [Paracoccaceae bacterium]